MTDMKTLYCAIGYVCNEHCRFCPCSEGSVNVPSLTYDEICSTIRRAIEERGVENILLSGGEPTIHPEFFRILEFIKGLNVNISMLTNALRLADEAAATYRLYRCGGTDHTGPMSGCGGRHAIPVFNGVTEEEYFTIKERRLR